MSDTPTHPDAPASVPAVPSIAPGLRPSLQPRMDAAAPVDTLQWHIERANAVRQKTADKMVKVPRYPELVACLPADRLDQLEPIDAKFARVHLAAAKGKHPGAEVILPVAHYHKLVSLAVQLEA